MKNVYHADLNGSFQLPTNQPSSSVKAAALDIVNELKSKRLYSDLTEISNAKENSAEILKVLMKKATAEQHKQNKPDANEKLSPKITLNKDLKASLEISRASVASEISAIRSAIDTLIQIKKVQEQANLHKRLSDQNPTPDVFSSPKKPKIRRGILMSQ